MLTFYLVSAVTVFGDPTFTHGQSFDQGTDTTSDGVSDFTLVGRKERLCTNVVYQIFARDEDGASLALLNTYAAKLKSYCDTGDVYCASGDDSSAHSQEVPTWGSAAVQFITSLST